MSTSPLRIDPYRSFNFAIALIDSSSALAATATAIGSVVAGGFSECTGLEMSLEVEEYREGGNNGTVLRFPTRMKWNNLRLKRGVALLDDLWLWHYGFAQGQVQRRDGVVSMLDEQQNPVKVWSFTRGLPVKWSGPSLNAAQNQVAIEELEIAHEGLRLL
jgi:phage tail-like protein